MQDKIRVGVIGLGHWGSNYMRLLNELTESELTLGCDLDEVRIKANKKMYPDASIVKDYRAEENLSKLDAVIIATPPNTHFEIAEYFLKEGKHVLVEKPFVGDGERGKELIDLASEKNLILMAAHINIFNPGIIALKKLIDEGELGKVFYLISERNALGPIRKQVNALWDLAVHDVYTAIYLLGVTPSFVYAKGHSFIKEGVEDLISLDLEFPGGTSYEVAASWYAPEKVRRLTAVGSKGMAVFDDVTAGDKLVLFQDSLSLEKLDTTPEYMDFQNIINQGPSCSIGISDEEPLKKQTERFFEYIREEKFPITDLGIALETIKILKEAEEFLKEKNS